MDAIPHQALSGELRGNDASKAAQTLAPILRTLADPTRLSIYFLLRSGEACVCELANALGLAENLVSHHLGVLRRSHLVIDRRDPCDARWVYYQLNREALNQLALQFGALFDTTSLGERAPMCGPAALLTVERRARERLP